MEEERRKTFPKVSVVIPCYNAQNTIGACLKGLISQDYSSYEIIAVDDNSKDDTVRILQSFQEVRIIRNKDNQGPAFSRNLAVRESSGGIILLIDSDCLIEDAQLIAKHVSAHATTYAHIIGGGIKGIGKGWVASADNYSHWFLNIPYSSGRVKTHLVTNNMSIKRHVFESLNGFDTRLRTGEDTDFCERALKAGYILGLKTDAVVKHLDRERFGDFVKNFYLVGKDRIPARANNRHRYWYLLPSSFIMSAIYCLPLAFLLTFQIIFSWFPYDKRVVFYFPLIFTGRLAMAFGIVSYCFQKSLCGLKPQL